MIYQNSVTCFQTTYEELKLGFWTDSDASFGFQTTYEELKRLATNPTGSQPIFRFQTTYEELKQVSSIISKP